ncbi:MAG: putative ABC transporter permease [Flintibacter sp.]|uniref:putative ABC transporter permease n=1 Tax=Flintibacter sp. TaxID=1918624 RepID=UPI00267341B8|nr:putative ABC transporter permease [Flintibacter sp.]MCI6151437.1 putative ABC transporter permease [Flintibacter sp.]MDD7115126.1 putative ABC transporter permease [Flintibacter sp.]MDY5038370.1 putative ABC transporter permease [Lawsonibacter sp.]
MTIFIILLLLLLVLLSSAEAASGAFRVPKLRWHQWFFLFLSSAFLGCLFEMGVVWLGTGVLMSRSSLLLERVFHRLFWNYSHLPFNLDGRTNLLYAVFWGLAGVVLVYWLAPYLLRLAEKIPRKSGQAIFAGLAVLLALDMLLSAAAFWRMEERSRGSVPSNHLEYMLDTWYGDQAMQQRYQNMELPHSVS